MRIRFATALRRSLVLVAVAAVSSLTAAAQNITYKFSGVGSGTLGSTSFASKGFSFSVTVPTSSVSTVQYGPNTPSVNNVVMNFTIDGLGSGTLSNAYVFNNRSNGVVGFGSSARMDLIDLFNLPGMTTYSLVTNVAPVTATGSNIFFGQFNNQPTSLGTLNFTSIPSVTFEASTTVGVVPEPSTYALLGTGLVGLAGLSRRRRATV